MKDKFFLDTNIILYQFSSDIQKKNRAIDILDEATNSNKFTISYQVIQEFSNVALNKNKGYFSIKELKTYIEDILIPLCKFFPDPSFYIDSLKVKEKYKFSYYDSLIINAALELKCSKLYSEDLQANQKIENLEIINPFR
ncbi:PIN domain-containing protein [Leptospira congkakensis]|uniref:PIN domain-containing protein n=1 Tax=Leptospira congkakensis TaxID=2484932 RepID=A0A4Z1ABM6_9LEPT|nr:PIN domain-containing protein [Leptospira congkakensis]TGL87345.1 PIN domain-containing protein [Leptospira congkakensis]TGL96911.1 PIN domain-containing protein [Leptospira congkakensis]TGL97763.1 PIN domain-containing protein [Leptospira congkakensis]